MSRPRPGGADPSAEYPRGSRGGAATRLRGIIRAAPAASPRPSAIQVASRDAGRAQELAALDRRAALVVLLEHDRRHRGRRGLRRAVVVVVVVVVVGGKRVGDGRLGPRAARGPDAREFEGRDGPRVQRLEVFEE